MSSKLQILANFIHVFLLARVYQHLMLLFRLYLTWKVCVINNAG